MPKIKNDTLAPEPSAPIDNSDLAAAILQLASQFGASQQQIATTLEALQANQPKREPDYSEYLERNPTPKLLKPAFQNAYPINPHGLSEATVKKLAELKPGRYPECLKFTDRHSFVVVSFESVRSGVNPPITASEDRR